MVSKILGHRIDSSTLHTRRDIAQNIFFQDLRMRQANSILQEETFDVSIIVIVSVKHKIFVVKVLRV